MSVAAITFATIATPWKDLPVTKRRLLRVGQYRAAVSNVIARNVRRFGATSVAVERGAIQYKKI